MPSTHFDERLVYYQYIFELFEGRRVIEIGAGTAKSLDLVSQTAAHVMVLDSDAEALDRCRLDSEWSNVTFTLCEPDRLLLEAKSADLVLVPQLGRFVTHGRFLPEIRRVLCDDGLAFFAAPNGDAGREGGMAYDDFEEYLGMSFEHLRLLGAIPFVGRTIADFFPDDDLAPALDSSLLDEDEPPLTYGALCSRLAIPYLGYSVVQVPTIIGGALPAETGNLEEAWTSEVTPTRGSAREVPRVLTQLNAVGATERTDLERRLESERERTQALTRQCAEDRGRAEAERSRAEQAAKDVAEWRGAVEEYRRRTEAAERRSDALMIRIEQGAAELSHLHQRMAELQGLRQADQWQIDELTGRLRELEQQANEKNGQATPDDIAGGAEQALEEARTHIEELEAELMRSQSRVTEQARRATNAEAKIAEHEVRLKRSLSEAATLSKWAEELREDLKEAEGRSSVRPPTPEPEVAALRRELEKARARVQLLETRCDELMAKAERTTASLAQKQAELDAVRSATSENGASVIASLRAENATLAAEASALKSRAREADELAAQLRDAEQAASELGATRAELDRLRRRVADLDDASDELEQLRMQSGRSDALAEELMRVKAELRRVQEQLQFAGADDDDDLAPNDAQADGTPPSEAWTGELADDDEPAVDGELGDLEGRLEMQDHQIDALLEGAAMHRDEMERLSTAHRATEAYLAELERERQVVETELMSCKASAQQSTATFGRLQSENQQLSRDVARLSGELKRCRAEGAATATARSALAAGNSTAGPAQDPAQNPVLRKELEREIRERRHAQEELGRHLITLASLRKDLLDREKTVAELRSDGTLQRAELRELKTAVRTLERELEHAARQKADGEARITELENATASQRAAHDQSFDEVTIDEAEPDGTPRRPSTASLQALSAEIQSLHAQLEHSEAGRSACEQELDALRAELRDAEELMARLGVGGSDEGGEWVDADDAGNDPAGLRGVRPSEVDEAQAVPRESSDRRSNHAAPGRARDTQSNTGGDEDS